MFNITFVVFNEGGGCKVQNEPTTNKQQHKLRKCDISGFNFTKTKHRKLKIQQQKSVNDF